MADAHGRDEIIVVSPTFYPERIGTPLYVFDIARSLVGGGRKCRVVTSQPYYPAFERFPGYGRARRRDDVEGIPVFRAPTIVPRRGGAAWRAVSEANFLLQIVLAILTGRIGRGRAVLAVTPGVPFAILAGAALRRRGGRLVAVVHDVQFGLVAATTGAVSERLAGLSRAVEVWALNRADVVTVLTVEMRDVLVDAGVSRPIEVVPLWPTIVPDHPCLEGDPCTVLYSGNLGRKQGLSILLDVAERLSPMVPDARIVIRGDGPERQRLVAEASRRGLGNIDFQDFVPEDGLAAALAAAAVHVVPQVPEGADHAVPSKIYNILAVGRPVIATACENSTLGRMSEEVEALRVVEPGDLDGLVREIASLLKDDAERRRLGLEAGRWIQSAHNRIAAVESYVRMLDGPRL